MNHDKFFSISSINFFRVCEEEELTAKVGGLIWRMHKNDKDRWPSSPHAHEVRGCRKLDLFTGHMYSAITKKWVGRLTDGELEAVRRQLQFGG